MQYTTSFIPDTDGDWEFGFGSAGSINLFFDGKQIINNSSEFEAGELFFTFGSTEKRAIVKGLKKGQEYAIEARGQFRFNLGQLQVPYGLRLGARPVIDEQQRIREAAELAKKSDVAVIMVGLNADFESEGMDRKHME